MRLKHCLLPLNQERVSEFCKSQRIIRSLCRARELTPFEIVGLFPAREFAHVIWLHILLESVDTQIIASLDDVIIVIMPEVSFSLVLSSLGLLEYLVLFSLLALLNQILIFLEGLPA
jgi:hypothetical protein